MNPKQILALKPGDKVGYAGRTISLCDWRCHPDPVFASDGTRIDADPVFRFPDGHKQIIHAAFWQELTPLSTP